MASKEEIKDKQIAVWLIDSSQKNIWDALNVPKELYKAHLHRESSEMNKNHKRAKEFIRKFGIVEEEAKNLAHPPEGRLIVTICAWFGRRGIKNIKLSEIARIASLQGYFLIQEDCGRPMVEPYRG